MPNFKKLLHSLPQQVNQKLTLRRRNLKWLSFSLMFRQLAGQLSSFYLPLFLFKVSANFEIGQGGFTPLQQGMILLSMFYLFERLVAALFSLVEANLTIKIGHEQAMLFGTLIYTLFLLTLSYVEKHPLMIFVGAFLSGIQMVFYWQSYNTLITRLSFKNSMGKNLSILRFIKNFISMLGPALGGLIITFFGFNYLFYVSIVALVVSLIGIIKLDLPPEKDEVNLQEYLSWLKEKRFNRLVLSQAGRYFNDMSLVLWPLYVFLLMGDVTKVGYIYSISLFLAMIINLFMGDILDGKKKSKVPFFVSGGFLSSLWMVKAFVVNAWGIVLVDSFDKMVGNFHWLFHANIVFKRGKGKQDFSYFVYRMTNRSIAAAVFWTLLLIFFLVVPLEWSGLFALGSAGVLLSLLAKEGTDE